MTYLYTGKAFDQLDSLETLTTRRHKTYKDAHDNVEKMLHVLPIDTRQRYTIEIETFCTDCESFISNDGYCNC